MEQKARAEYDDYAKNLANMTFEQWVTANGLDHGFDPNDMYDNQSLRLKYGDRYQAEQAKPPTYDEWLQTSVDANGRYNDLLSKDDENG